jgi:hypothetical protein
MVIDGWAGYINPQIVASAYMAGQICNFDEANVDFNPAPHSMLSKIGERTVSLWVFLKSSCLHSSFGRVFRMVVFSGIVSRMCFLGIMCTQCNLVGGWMEKRFKNGCNVLSGHIHSYTTIAFTCY